MKLLGALPLLGFCLAEELADPRSQFIERGPVSSKCGSLQQGMAATNFKDFPDIKKFPQRNYVVRYRTKRGVDTVLIGCRDLRKKQPIRDIEAKKQWEKQVGKKFIKGRMRCKNGKWRAQKKYKVPSCPSIAKGAWHNFMNPPETTTTTTTAAPTTTTQPQTTRTLGETDKNIVTPPPVTGMNKCGIRKSVSRIVNGKQANKGRSG